ncbi:alpha/beta fold hydrolase [Aestuariicella sp. G3-2]|uniref:alpha/beta fold hydrolase n=1 Tax=Pseudomaricurvus albidus TaxID=2842452 RepID=UPI001C0B5B8D|nr:alpha/beta fold hydrolase [Aestuariicella albida]MBU3070611.1 alpha/beta fold hydrolase [Aestuariicella albida]
MERRVTAWISQGLEQLIASVESSPDEGHDYDVVIIGSGYGGAIAASQLAGLSVPSTTNGTPRPLKVCVLERGNEYLPGMFPSRLADLPEHVRFNTPNNPHPSGNRDGLFDIRVGPHLNTVLANGLGGGSLINAGVMIEPTPETFDQRWPAGLQYSDKQELFTHYYAETKQLLGAEDNQGANTILRHKRHQQNPLSKNQQMQLLATDKANPQQSSHFHQASITMAMEDKINAAGVALTACNLCGDCATGCNHNAKESLDTNLLVQASQKGVELYTGATVLSLAPTEDITADDSDAEPGWTLNLVHTKSKLRRQQRKPFKLTAAKVILAAGSFGSTEILLRSQSERLPLSQQLGQRFSSNGDMLATVFNQNDRVNAIADENSQPHERDIGPTITGVIDLRRQPEGILIEEMAVPGALRRFYEEVVTTTNSLSQLMERDKSIHLDGQPENDPCNVDVNKINRTGIFAIMGDDGSKGSLQLVVDHSYDSVGNDNCEQDPFIVASTSADDLPGDGGITVQWSGLPENPLFTHQIEVLEDLVKRSQSGGQAQGNPAWRPLPKSMEGLFGDGKGPQLTVHPLGGCAMADNHHEGVVDQFGRVFNPADHSRCDAVYDNLVVMDGAMIPSALGANPALTIAAVSLRAIRQLRQVWGFDTAVSAAGQQPANTAALKRPQFADKSVVPPVKPTRIEITERICGNVTLTDRNHRPVDCVVDITLRFEPKPVLDFVRNTKRTLTVDRRHREDEPVCQMRIFRREQWQSLIHEGASDETFDRNALFTAPVFGTMEIMGRENSTSCERITRTLWPWLRNRGARDTYQGIAKAVRRHWLQLTNITSKGNISKDSNANKENTVLQKIRNVLALASRGGEQRMFDYQLTIERPESGWPSALAGFDPERSSLDIKGHKRIRYTRAANPMRQFEDMYLEEFPGLQPRRRQPGKKEAFLRFDSRFITHYRKPLIRIVDQQDQATALADIGSFFAFFLRILLNIHLWSFRKPDEQLPGAPNRLPGRIKGVVKPEITELTVDSRGIGLAVDLPVKVRLTRYRQPNSTEPPLVMIHGYSASGTTYTHPSINPNMAQYFWKRGRDVWVLDLRTSSGMPTAMLPWSFEDVAFADIPVAIEHICQKTKREKVDIIAHCMGSAMFSMAVLAPPENDAPYFRERQLLPQRINKAVLSQVGPRVVFSPENIFRAYGLSYLQQMMPFMFYSFKRSDAPSTMEALLDRLLSALPYPDGEFDLENPGLPWAKTAYVGTRHRMDGLYGRTFSLANLSKKTLDHIDDIFGPLNMVTLSQVIRFAIHERVTNRHGENEFVTNERLQKFWKFPTLSIHGDENGLADISTLGRMEKTMSAAGCDYHTEVLPGFGHQDALIGKNAKVNFAKIDRFLQQPVIVKQHTPIPRYDLQLPFSGPVIGKLNIDTTPKLPVSLGVCTQTPQPEFVLFVAVKHQPGSRNPERPPQLVLANGPEDSLQNLTTEQLRENLCVKMARPLRDRWLKTELPVTAPFEKADEVLVLVLDDLNLDLDELTYSSHLPDNLLDVIDRPSSAGNDSHQQLSQYLQQHLFSETFMELFSKTLQMPLAKLQNGLIRIPKPSVPDQTQFVMAACQYAPGMLDRIPAYNSYRRLAARLDKADAATNTIEAPQFLILGGDQVYTDASAGLYDPTDRYDRFAAAYHKWLQQPPVKSVLRRLPTFTMLDDHEILNDWDQSERHLGNPQLYANGKRAYLNFQRNLHQTPKGKNLRDMPLWYTFEQQGFDFFMLDSRSDRQGRTVSTKLLKDAAENEIATTEKAQLISKAQMDDLKDWLLKPTDGRPRFILSPSMLLPRRLCSTQPCRDSSIHSDAWDGYPSTLHELLSFIANHNIGNLVFLSGDEHLSSAVEITLRHKENDTETNIYSVHSSGLYSPFTFVNSTPELFAGDEEFLLNSPAEIECQVRSRFFPGDGFAVFSVFPDSDNWIINCEFDREETSPEHQVSWRLKSSNHWKRAAG